MRCLVTAGNTREKIDDVRMWSNIFSGATGLSIATALADFADVDLVTSNEAHVAQVNASKTAAHPIHASAFGSHAELKGALATLLARQKYDAIFMTAAVADYKPTRVYAVLDRQRDADGTERWRVADAQAGKIKSTHKEIAVLGGQTEKLVDLFRTMWHHTGLLVKFKLEVGITPEEMIRVGEISRRSSDAEYLFANTLDMTTGPKAGAYLLSEKGSEWVPRAELANRAARLVSESNKNK